MVLRCGHRWRSLACLLSLGAVAWGAVACSQLVDPDALEIRCELRRDEEDPCQALGMRCGSADICETCDPQNERCNGFDDDCDGKVDEGHDLDGDGYNWCGSGDQSLRDCLDTDPDIHPPRVGPDGDVEELEVCNGYDDDCNGLVDDAAGCVQVDCPQEACPSGLQCDLASGTCVAPRPTGSGCKSDVECDGGFCLSTAVLGLGSEGRNGDRDESRICATACCRDADCPGGAACMVASSGVRACVPPSQAARAPAGDECGDGGDCASGLCREGRCAGTCSSNGDCSGEDLCVADAAGTLLFGGSTVWTCGEARGRNGPGEFCTPFDPRACESGLCFEGFVAACAAPCGTSDDCPDDSTCEFYDDGTTRYPVCLDNASGQTTCCTDADCGGDETCKPIEAASGWSMHCR